MLKVMIIDDEIYAIETLEEDLNKYVEDVIVVGTCNKPLLAKEMILEHRPDLVFLDIEMPRMNGFELLASFEEVFFDVVFVTAHNQFAIKAFELSAADYLVKPVEKSRLKETVNKLQKKKGTIEIEKKLTAILHNLQLGSNQFPTLAVPSSEGVEFMRVENILYLKSDRNYTYIYTSDGEHIYIAKTLKHFIKLLEEFEFVRIHQSYFVNVRYIKKYTKSDGGEVVLISGERLPVSRNCKQNILKYIQR